MYSVTRHWFSTHHKLIVSLIQTDKTGLFSSVYHYLHKNLSFFCSFILTRSDSRCPLTTQFFVLRCHLWQVLILAVASPRNMVTSAWRKFHTVYDDTKPFNIIRHELLSFFLETIN